MIQQKIHQPDCKFYIKRQSFTANLRRSVKCLQEKPSKHSEVKNRLPIIIYTASSEMFVNRELMLKVAIKISEFIFLFLRKKRESSLTMKGVGKIDWRKEGRNMTSTWYI